MGGWGVFLGLRIFFLKIFHPKIKSVQNGLKCKKKHIKIFLFSTRKPTARAVHFPARADARRPGPPLCASLCHCSNNEFEIQSS